MYLTRSGLLEYCTNPPQAENACLTIAELPWLWPPAAAAESDDGIEELAETAGLGEFPPWL
jgi:hypothetical protein